MYSHLPTSSNQLSHFQSYNQRDYSNNVLISQNGMVYFLPCYLRVVFLQVEDIQIKELTANFYAIILLTVYHKNLPDSLFEELKQIKFSARNVETISLNGNSDEKQSSIIRKNVTNSTMQYSYRGKLPLRLECDVMMAPFEAIDFKLLLTFHKKSIFKDNKHTQIKFNFMDIDDMQTKCIILYRDSNISGEYGLAQSSISVQFGPFRQKHINIQRKKLISQLPPHLIQANAATQEEIFKIPGGLIHEARVYAWRYVTYRFKMYRYPINIILIIFVPLWILSFTNIVIFWASPADVSGRLQTISGLMIAYAALLPTIRDKIPPSPNITLLQYMVYSLSFTIFLSTLQTLIAAIDNTNPPGYVFVWNRNWRFLMCIVITIATMVIFFALSMIYKCIWQPRYNFVKDTKYGLQFEDFTVDTEVWYNSEATNYLKDKTTIVPPPVKGFPQRIHHQQNQTKGFVRRVEIKQDNQKQNTNISNINNQSFNNGNYQTKTINQPSALSNNPNKQDFPPNNINKQPALFNNSKSQPLPSNNLNKPISYNNLNNPSSPSIHTNLPIPFSNLNSPFPYPSNSNNPPIISNPNQPQSVSTHITQKQKRKHKTPPVNRR